MAHIAGQWGTKINIHKTPYEFELSFVEPHAPTNVRRISHSDAAQLRDALDMLLLDHPEPSLKEVLAEVERRNIASVCEALGVEVEVSDGHGMRAYTWPEILELIKSRDTVWRQLLTRIEQVDPEWLDTWRKRL